MAPTSVSIRHLELNDKKQLNFFAKIYRFLSRPNFSAGYVPQIDGLRAVAIILVLCWHSSIRAARYANDLHSSGQSVRSLYLFVPHGEVGVALFFFLSGLVIAKPYLTKRTPSKRQFYLRRFRRIYPPYLIALLISFFVLSVLHQDPGHANSFIESQIPLGQSLLASLVYMHSLLWGTASRLLPPAWSLEIEIQFYLLAPFLLPWYATGMRPEKQRKMVILIAVLLLTVNVFEVYYTFDNRFRYGFIKHLHLFLAGILAADIASAQSDTQLNQRRHGDACFLMGLGLLLGIGCWMTRVDAKPTGGLSSLLSDTSQLIGVCLVYFGAMYGNMARAVLSRRWFCFIGTMCYSIYLIHIPLMQAISERLLRRLELSNPLIIWPIWMTTLILSSLIASLLYYILVERPFMGAKTLPKSN